MTRSVVSQDNDTVVECASSHLTSFAVLVNVAGTDVSFDVAKLVHCNS